MYSLIFKPRAIHMQKEAYAWYEQKQTGLGELFLNELEENYLKLQQNPEYYSKTDEVYRYLILRKFPYIIAFRIIKSTVAVFHTSRDPQEKLKRK